MSDTLVRSLLAEPAVADPPERVWRDWALVGVLVPVALLEGLLRNDVVWRPVSIVLALAALVALLWRRTHPFATTTLAFGTLAVVSVAEIVVGDVGQVGLYSMAAILLLPYAQFRWGSGQRSAIALVVILLTGMVAVIEDYTGIGDAIGGHVVLLFPAVLGAEVRHLTGSRQRELDDVKVREREQIARELHDTVAHHVSAILIQAQAGRTVAPTRPAAATDALARIEEEAARTLAEMRSIVGSLRGNTDAELVPQPRACDITRLAANVPGPTQVDVRFEGDFSDLTASIDNAVYRLVQESITNARRHARQLTLIDVAVIADDQSVQLAVRDDGHSPSKRNANAVGYGIIGMSERAALLGGTLHAGPNPEGGWVVTASLPRTGSGA